MLTRRTALAGAAALTAAGGIRPVRAQGDTTIRIGVLNDESGVYRDVGGPGSVACVKQAVAEYASQNGVNVEVRVADQQNKPDVAVGIARQWFAEGVDVITDIQGSAIALGLQSVVKNADKVMLACNVGTSDLTGKACSPNTIHFAYDTYMVGSATGSAVVKQGGDTWFFIRADYAFGKSLQSDTTGVIERNGGKVVGSIAVPFPNTDFSGALIAAQSSGAKIIGLAEAGTDLVNCLKQAAEFGITKRGQKLAALLLFINDVHAIGLSAVQGLVLSNTFYWDLNDRTRKFTARVREAIGAPPNMSQAANYTAVLHYLKAVKAIGVPAAKQSGLAAIKWMKANKIEDDAYGEATIRPDGLTVSPGYLCEVKSPEQSKHPWDYYKVLATIPVADAWRPLNAGGCPLVT
ncbi:MAG: ABC transporter substrate-binding protein [Alphaproteobacteria bacterium]|nr:ABC transporter substrate-binding protein [Alphaproteobacteria bacterium]